MPRINCLSKGYKYPAAKITKYLNPINEDKTMNNMIDNDIDNDELENVAVLSNN